MIKEEFYQFIRNLQNEITDKLESYESDRRFKEDIWHREEGGGGHTRILENGEVFEKAGVNVSRVFGSLSQSLEDYFQIENAAFEASGISLVIHPRNPFVPTVHANFRYFELYDHKMQKIDSWFGGGLDLTPYYLFEEDAIHFHSVCKRICDQFKFIDYFTFKETCDRYFYNQHRGEARGIGGLFYDHLRASDEIELTDYFTFQKAMASHFLEAYIPIVDRRIHTDFDSNHKEWQLIRRGRYVEFNLIHDRGTLFGLKSNGRIESIFMSLPPEVKWKYNHTPQVGSDEEKLLEVLKHPRNWV